MMMDIMMVMLYGEVTLLFISTTKATQPKLMAS